MKLSKTQSELIETVLGRLTGNTASEEIREFLQEDKELFFKTLIIKPLESLLLHDEGGIDFLELQNQIYPPARLEYFNYKKNRKRGEHEPREKE